MKRRPFDAFDFIPDDYLNPKETIMKVTLQFHHTEDAAPPPDKALVLLEASALCQKGEEPKRVFEEMMLGRRVDMDDGTWGFALEGCEPQDPEDFYAWAELPAMPAPRPTPTVDDYEKAVLDLLVKYEEGTTDDASLVRSVGELYNRFPSLRMRARREAARR